MRRARTTSTVIFAVGYLLIAVAYLWAPPTSRGPGVVSVITYIRDLGPIWSCAFTVAAGGFFAAIATRRYLWLAHSVAAAVTAGYGAAALAGGLLSAAIYGSPTALLAFVLTAQHIEQGRSDVPVPPSAGAP